MVGKQLSLVVNDIRSIFYSSNPTSFNIHCIGHSLGAHTCGYASKGSSIPFNRISGLIVFQIENPMFQIIKQILFYYLSGSIGPCWTNV